MGVIYDFATLFKKQYRGTVAFRIKKHAKVVENYINNDEKIVYAFCGQKNDRWYDIFSSCVVTVTNKRILIGQKRVFFGSYYTQITPDLYNDMKIITGLFWGKVCIDTVKEVITISNLSIKSLDDIETNVSQLMMREKKHRNSD